MTLSVRRATPADEATLVMFNKAIAWETEHKRLDPAVLAAGVRAVLADPARGFYTVAERGGEVVGQMMITFEWSDWRNGWFWWVQSVYVHEDARRGGVFRALYRAIEQQAAADPSVIGLRLYFETDNARARATYRALGMTDTTYGLMERYPLPGRESHVS
ncbi:GNAT family N-acetyltransferase [Frigoriglobus tundricola]|uniref:Acetyltransferase, GNAT family n=1 Tax=Frigoriglobus tundricola TaxID=2774151 RepID=A0A6M5YPY4_9BACT|nr:GNAT family N-acetyltransferase [Frigoriglobus tundricola]QJW95988.1 Acetyltransferase, GNAT family [Frigoriglobus tundricola]